MFPKPKPTVPMCVRTCVRDIKKVRRSNVPVMALHVLHWIMCSVATVVLKIMLRSQVPNKTQLTSAIKLYISSLLLLRSKLGLRRG